MLFIIGINNQKNPKPDKIQILPEPVIIFLQILKMELMGYSSEIEHEGVVSTADERSVTVLLSRATACSGCHSEKLCGISGKEEKIVTINGKYGVSPGDHVTVTMKRSLGYSALLLGYVLPLSVVLLLLIILTALSVNELSSGLFSIGALVPYYAILFLYRKYLDKKFFFIIKS